MSDSIDMTSVTCPNSCRGELTKPKEFYWYDGSVGENNYCTECGAELVEAEV